MKDTKAVFTRHGFVQCMLAASFAAAAAGAYAQQTYPTRPVRLIVPSAPGGGTDISARLIAPKLSEYLGEQVIVENRAGAAMMIGGEAVARAAPDGYTLLMGISTLTVNPAIQKKMPFDAIRDFAPISLVVSLPNILVSHPSLPTKTVKELIAFVKARPGQLNFASAGRGSSVHMSMELFLAMTGLKAVHVPYKGSDLYPESMLDTERCVAALMTSEIAEAMSSKR
jgi:tripartite-type tricarboxylate transporter receptor subunit TctC